MRFLPWAPEKGDILLFDGPRRLSRGGHVKSRMSPFFGLQHAGQGRRVGTPETADQPRKAVPRWHAGHRCWARTPERAGRPPKAGPQVHPGHGCRSQRAKEGVAELQDSSLNRRMRAESGSLSPCESPAGPHVTKHGSRSGRRHGVHSSVVKPTITICRPDFAVMCYSGYLKAKDKDELAPGLHVPAELHLYATAAHDFGVRPVDHPCSTWTQLYAHRLRHHGLLQPPAPSPGPIP